MMMAAGLPLEQAAPLGVVLGVRVRQPFRISLYLSSGLPGGMCRRVSG